MLRLGDTPGCAHLRSRSATMDPHHTLPVYPLPRAAGAHGRGAMVQDVMEGGAGLPTLTCAPTATLTCAPTATCSWSCTAVVRGVMEGDTGLPIPTCAPTATCSLSTRSLIQDVMKGGAGLPTLTCAPTATCSWSTRQWCKT